MNQQEITTLKLFESLERDPNQTQRKLAKELNISLGLVNAFTKRLVRKGFFKIRTIPRNRVNYILTPKGMYEKTRLTYQYLLHSLEFYKETRFKFKSMYDRFLEQGKKKIFLVGACELTEIALIALHECDLELGAVVDPQKTGSRMLGNPVRDGSALQTVATDDVVVIMRTDFEKDFYSLIQRQVDSTGIVSLLMHP